MASSTFIGTIGARAGSLLNQIVALFSSTEKLLPEALNGWADLAAYCTKSVPGAFARNCAASNGFLLFPHPTHSGAFRGDRSRDNADCYKTDQDGRERVDLGTDPQTDG